MTWPIRENIIDGIAQGLLYIHNLLQPEMCIVHRDLKASNILLDHQMNPKISDFGIAMFSSSATEPHDTVPMGTP
jgi:serine/threonine protein kinase